MTAEAMVCRLFLEAEDGPATLNEAARFIVQQPPGQGRDNLYFWYYGTVALHQLHDEHWESWNRALQKHLLAGQRYDAALAGSWDPTTVWGGYGGRVYSTAMATLCLEVYYRYLPLYRPSGDAPADAVAGP